MLHDDDHFCILLVSVVKSDRLRDASYGFPSDSAAPFSPEKTKKTTGPEFGLPVVCDNRLIDDCQLRQRTFTQDRRPKKEAAPKVKPAKKLVTNLHVNTPQINYLCPSSRIIGK
jgi:hypothetical protein